MHTLISSKPSSTSSLVKAMPSMPDTLHDLPHQAGVEPAAAALAARHHAELLPSLAELARRSRPSARSGTGRSRRASYRPWRCPARSRSTRGPHAGAGRGLRRHRVRRGHERIGAVVDVEQGALRALEQDALAGATRSDRAGPRRRRRRAGCCGAISRQLAFQQLALDLRHAEPAPQRVVMHQQAIDLGAERAEILQVLRADRPAPDLVLVGRADAAPGGADLARRRPRSRAAGRARDAAAGSAWRSRRCADCRRRPSRPALPGGSISSPSAQGSTTTPLPMTESLPGRTTPEGSSDSL